MRVPILLACSLSAFSTLHAEALSDADREALLEKLEKLENASDSRVDARFRLAISAYRSALSSDDAAIELYLKCMEKVNFEDAYKRPAEFREWKRKEGEKLADPGMRLALRYQLRWLMLTLEAASSKPDRERLVSDAQDTLDSIFRDADKLKYQQQILTQSATSSVFARAYDINHVKVTNWSASPLDIKSIYDEVLLPPVRKPATVSALRAGWMKRIQQETKKMELWGEERRRRNEGDGEREEKRIAMADDMKSPEYTEFLEQELPSLQWEMELDLYRNGDQGGAATRMLAHLEKYLGHTSAREWTEQFKKLVNPGGAVTIDPAGKPPAAAPETATEPAAPAETVPDTVATPAPESDTVAAP